jgi:hypothetical protein
MCHMSVDTIRPPMKIYASTGGLFPLGIELGWCFDNLDSLNDEITHQHTDDAPYPMPEMALCLEYRPLR